MENKSMLKRIVEVLLRTLVWLWRIHWLGFIADLSGVKFTIGADDFILWAAADYRVEDPNQGQRCEAGARSIAEASWFEDMHLLLKKKRWVRKPKNNIGYITLPNGAIAYEVFDDSLVGL